MPLYHSTAALLPFPVLLAGNVIRPGPRFVLSDCCKRVDEVRLHRGFDVGARSVVHASSPSFCVALWLCGHVHDAWPNGDMASEYYISKTSPNRGENAVVRK